MSEHDKRELLPPFGPRNPFGDLGDILWNRRTPRPGFRYFRCECGHEWIEASRDAASPSGDECQKCSTWCMASEATTEQYDRLKGAKS